jgi:hypothetical protein
MSVMENKKENRWSIWARCIILSLFIQPTIRWIKRFLETKLQDGDDSGGANIRTDLVENDKQFQLDV